MKVAVHYGMGGIRIEDRPDPVLSQTGIIIKIRACGICGSDLHPTDTWDTTNGMILGHEFSGDVIEVGPKVAGIKAGDRVTAMGYENCGACYWCGKDMPHRCTDRKYVGYAFPGGFAEYVSIPVAIPDVTVFKLPDVVSYEEGATVEPLSIAVYSARRADPISGKTVFILGAGMIGQCIMKACQAMGADKLIISEMGRKRIEVAQAMGADVVIDAGRENVRDRLSEETGKTGPDIVFECAGSPAAFQSAIDLVRDSGKVMIVGISPTPVPLMPFDLIRKNITMIGCLGGSFPRAIDFITSGKISTKGLVTHNFPIEKAKEAFEIQMNPQETVKVLITP